MHHSPWIPPFNKQRLIRIGNAQKQSFENSLRRDWQFDRIPLFKVAVYGHNLIVKDREVCIVVPDEIGPRARDDRLERGGLDNCKFFAIA